MAKTPVAVVAAQFLSLGSVLCSPFCFFEAISQWEMGFILVLQLVCYLHVFEVIAVLEEQQEICPWNGSGHVSVVADQV